ncbi:phosphopantetheine-binding protein [Burkholderia gladioli]|jgi:D-alanine--poly(phosphoribitol) ligase subunit 2|uniref:phosphopantetheine-binding protein n=1 Tax=Burkholderia gladioli TaxID=28095 RepID=UPI001640C6C4|nr:phosphopantetheine-binding protein [Burkholderia gladioli]MBU9180273.1 hypothetical protein [Burkholderia gladioli]MBU9325990.1 hypothetical protein [Burkholderia gladioli]MBU9688057.1 hypothetical protein [Burkholderia gladioli]MCA8168924.1 phosphopantetheine-binding protein [Burkholderia gladioli]
MENQIREFIEATFLVQFGADIDDHTDLFKAGVIDSFGYVQLIHFIEREFSIKYTEEEMLTQILTSFDSLVESVRDKVALA